jgi:hypothetical protein
MEIINLSLKCLSIVIGAGLIGFSIYSIWGLSVTKPIDLIMIVYYL